MCSINLTKPFLLHKTKCKNNTNNTKSKNSSAFNYKALIKADKAGITAVFYIYRQFSRFYLKNVQKEEKAFTWLVFSYYYSSIFLLQNLLFFIDIVFASKLVSHRRTNNFLNFSVSLAFSRAPIIHNTFASSEIYVSYVYVTTPL